MQKNEEFEVRDLREKFFMVDDAYLNGWAKKCGQSATLVYMVLCRHSSRDQSCFPSEQLMADKMGITKRRVIGGIKTLEAFRIIHVSRTRGEKNVYFLLDKSNWIDPKPKTYVQRGPARKATRVEKRGVKVTWDGERMRPLSERT